MLDPLESRGPIPPWVPPGEADIVALTTGPPLAWQDMAAPPTSETSGGYWLGSVGDHALFRTATEVWRWSPDGGWQEMSLPPGHLVEAFGGGDTNAPLVLTTSTPRGTVYTLWGLDPDFNLVNPIELALPELPAQAEDHLLSVPIGAILVEGSRAEPYIVRSYAPTIDFTSVLRQEGLLTGEEWACDVLPHNEGLTVTVTTEAQFIDVQAIGACPSSADLRTIELTAEALGLSRETVENVAVHGSDHARANTLIHHIGGPADDLISHEMAGITHQIAAGQDLGVVVSTRLEADPAKTFVAHRRSASAEWTEQEIVGSVALTTNPDLAVIVQTVDEFATYTILRPGRWATAGRFDGPWQPVIDQPVLPSEMAAFTYFADPESNDNTAGLMLSADGLAWSINPIVDDIDNPQFISTVVTDSAVVENIRSAEGSSSFRYAPLHESAGQAETAAPTRGGDTAGERSSPR